MKIFITIASLVVLVALLGTAVAVYILFQAPIVPKNLAPRDFIIHRGMSLPQIADSLQHQGLIKKSDRFIFADKILGWGRELKAGKYTILPGASTLALYKLFRSGKATQQRVTLPEGKTVEDFAGILQRALEIDSVTFVKLAHDSALARRLGVPAPNLEGYLCPNTYYFYWGTSPQEVIRTLVQEFHRQVNDSLLQQARKLNFTLHQVVTLASIIEGEAAVDSERAIIAAVYHNRLRQGILLQADPTIQYLVPGPPRRLLNRDLEIDSPYNTYRYPGLPPGPVNNPGIASIRAALYPAAVKYIYFVARGDGSHVFSHTLQEHLRAKREFDRVRAQVRWEKKHKSQPGG
ncbi:MAG: endolytic transglycosylase MltG [candidate division KSB1 bacterium]|nr:endolytic transglycosylase MltG [candidate division KSB1 bacterium]MDZ7303310.1 endolytic transglycosylase MltG [candidate division KSB1 bacterium]MDZ7312612.1 endolytic transglycosylase MltG [candidate division KSB1 bacterium]